MNRLVIRTFLAWCCWFGASSLAEAFVTPVREADGPDRSWIRLLEEVEQLKLPTRFLKAIPPGFIHFEFDDLRTYAAEYHPSEHRLVLNRSLSVNGAGSTLKSLQAMTPKELDVLYHELFHAYMDYLKEMEEQRSPAGSVSTDLIRFAKQQQACRYAAVRIAPVAQRSEETELRYLTPSESWEALNETWAVFIGWTVWSQRVVQGKASRSIIQDGKLGQQWRAWLGQALQNREFRGYYVPEDQDERRVTKKRYLADPLTSEEAVVLLQQVLGLPSNFMNKLDIFTGHSGQSVCFVSSSGEEKLPEPNSPLDMEKLRQ